MKKIKCEHCKKLFKPCVYNKYSQKYCSEENCKKVSKKAADKKYLAKKRKNPEFRKNESKRVSKWRGQNPGYPKRYREKKIHEKNALHDIAKQENDIKYKVLHDIVLSLSLTFKGFMALVLEKEHDTLCDFEKAMYIRGLELLKGSSNLTKGGLSAEKTHLSKTETKNPSSI